MRKHVAAVKSGTASKKKNERHGLRTKMASSRTNLKRKISEVKVAGNGEEAITERFSTSPPCGRVCSGANQVRNLIQGKPLNPNRKKKTAKK